MCAGPAEVTPLQEYGPVVQIQMGSLAALVVSEEKDRREMLLTKVRRGGGGKVGFYFNFLSQYTFTAYYAKHVTSKASDML